ncbi:MAG: CheY-like chemotaxis protein, partial [Sulfurimonas sp.]
NAKNITITSFIDPHIPSELYADALRIKQVVSNFLSNAIKFTPLNGHITVEAFCTNSILKVSVRDTGIGIVRQDIENIFTAFTQAQFSEQENVGGTGLGLSICHQLAQLMKGSVNVESTFGKGSTFWIELPVETRSTTCPIYDDVDDFKSLKIVVYSKNIKDIYKEESFMRYANVFKMNAQIVDNIDGDFDVALFVEDDVDKTFISKAINLDKKFIAIGSKENDEYDKYNNIASISFPLYCSKIRNTFNELFNPDSYSPHKHEVKTFYIGHVLVAEDNEANQELIKILLKKYGLTFDLAHNGQEAVKLYKLYNYDLILMDEQMPVMDGNEAVKKILNYELKRGLRHTPISALTANVIKGAKERGLLSGFDSFLGKPIVLKDLERVFTKYLKIKSIPEFIENNIDSDNSIVGVDAKKLKEELILSEDELIMLLNLFIKKMITQIPILSDAIDKKDYQKIALNAHSIKGSSGNFRIDSIEHNASEMEVMAKSENSTYNYRESFEKIKRRVEEIRIK